MESRRAWLFLIAVIVALGLWTRVRCSSVPVAEESRRVDVGGFRIDCRVFGAGSPTVVFMSGSSAPQSYWGEIPRKLGEYATAVTFDRPGIGDSETGPMPRDAGHVVLEITTLLERLQVPTPYVVVGHSLGCIFARVFAGQNPETVAAVVLLDPGQTDLIDGFTQRLEGSERQGWVDYWRGARSSYDGRTDTVAREIQAVEESLRLQAATRLREDLPLVVVTAHDPAHPPGYLDRLKPESKRAYFAHVREFHEAISALTSAGKRITAEGSGHMIPLERPDFVVDLVKEMLVAVGTSEPSSER